jgi:hypothetical protein
VQLDTEIKRTGKGSDWTATLTAGKTEVQAKLNTLFRATPKQISGTITARKLFLWDLVEKDSEGEKKKSSKKEPVFSIQPGTNRFRLAKKSRCGYCPRG